MELMMSGCPEVIEFTRPDGSRKNLYITNIPGVFQEDKIVVRLHEIFDKYGLICGVQVYPSQCKVQRPDCNHGETTDANNVVAGYYAFVSFYSAQCATRAKEHNNSIVVIGDKECKVAYAKRKKELQGSTPLHFSKCQELAAHYLGFNGWSTQIKAMYDDSEEPVETDTVHRKRFVCVMKLILTQQNLSTEGVGAWEETYIKCNPVSKFKAICKCKKLCQQRALENAFSKVVMVVLPNGKVAVDINTTKQELLETQAKYSDNELLKVNNLDLEPELEEEANGEINSELSGSRMDDMNLQILQQLEDDM